MELYFESSYSKSSIFKTLTPNMCFGELSFITGNPHDFSARSAECSQLLKISREDFIETLQEFPEDKERFMMVRDSLIFYNDYELSNLCCYSCGKSNHLIKNCPYITFSPDNDFIIKKETYSQPQTRKPCVRRNKKSLNSLIIKNNLEELIKMKIKAEKTEKIYNFFEDPSRQGTINLDRSDDLSDVFLTSNFQLKQRSSTLSLPSQVGILKHYRQSRDFGAKRSVSFLSKEDKQVPIIKEENVSLEKISDKSSSSSGEEEFQSQETEAKDDHNKNLDKNMLWSIGVSESEKDETNPSSSASLPAFTEKSKELRFDKIKSFRYYFPYNNLEEIIIEMQQKKRKKLIMNQFYFKKAIMMNKITQMLKTQKRRSRAGVRNTILTKTFNFFKTIQSK